MKNFPQSFEPVGSDSILEQFIQLKNQTNEKLSSNEYVKTTPQMLTEEEKAQVRENIGAGASTINIIDNLNSQSNLDALSANQGRILNEKINQSVQELQNDIDANGGDIAGLQGDVSELNQQMQRTLKTPIVSPTTTELVGIDDNNSQIGITIGNGLKIENDVISFDDSEMSNLEFVGNYSSSTSMLSVEIDLSNYNYIAFVAHGRGQESNLGVFFNQGLTWTTKTSTGTLSQPHTYSTWAYSFSSALFIRYDGSKTYVFTGNLTFSYATGKPANLTVWGDAGNAEQSYITLYRSKKL